MHITSSSEGATITTNIFQVSDTFDSVPSTNNFKLVVTFESRITHLQLYSNWHNLGTCNSEYVRFPIYVSGGSYTATLQVSTQTLSIPPYQTGTRTITWNPTNAASFTLHISSG